MTNEQLNEKLDQLLNCVANNLDCERNDELAIGIKKSPPLPNTSKTKQQLTQLIKEQEIKARLDELNDIDGGMTDDGICLWTEKNNGMKLSSRIEELTSQLKEE